MLAALRTGVERCGDFLQHEFARAPAQLSPSMAALPSTLEPSPQAIFCTSWLAQTRTLPCHRL